MCKYDRTLRDIINECPMHFEEIISDRGLDKYNENLSYENLYKLYSERIGRTTAVITRKGDNLYCGFKDSSLERRGKRFYIYSRYTPSVIITPRSIKAKGDINYLFKFLCAKYGIKYDYLPLSRVSHIPTTIFKDILIGKVWGEESLYKDWMSILKIKNVSWRVFAKYYSLLETHYLYDMQSFTKNLENSMKVLIDRMENRENAAIYIDALTSAAQLNQIIDFTWSEKRMESEHQKQMDLVLEQELTLKDKYPIYDTSFRSSNFILLNTEMDIFKEAKNMHHCLYNCYYSKIKNHDYIAFHINAPESCTLGIRRAPNNDIILDQIYLKYDKPVAEETRKIALDFIRDNYHMFNNMLKPKEEGIKFTYDDLVCHGLVVPQFQ
jgi:hypothetical protein